MAPGTLAANSVAMIVEDQDVDIGAVDNAMRLSYEYGYDGGLFVGYDLGAFRIEAEAAYKKADLEGFNTIIRLPGEGAVFPPSRQFAGGSTSALSFMINGMLDFGDDDGISGFVGGGVGMARVKANNQRVFANTAPFLDDSDSKLAWQVFAGVRQAISDNIDVTVKYRFFNVDDVRMVAFNGTRVRASLPVAQPSRRDHLQLRWRAAGAGVCSAAAAAAGLRAAARAAGASASAAAGLRRGSVHGLLRLGQGRHHPAGRRDPRQCGFRLSDLRPGPGDDRGPRRPFGFGPVQCRSFAASRRERPFVPGRTRRSPTAS